jgi:hypothetical protein
MTETALIIHDLGGGWIRHGQDMIWIGPRDPDLPPDFPQDVIRLSGWHDPGGSRPRLRIQLATLDDGLDLADPRDFDVVFGSATGTQAADLTAEGYNQLRGLMRVFVDPMMGCEPA